MKRSHIMIHHTGEKEGSKITSASQVWVAHVKGNGWRDVGYNYLIEPNGTVVVGRSLDIRGAHCIEGNMNEKAIAICVLGNFDRNRPTQNQMNSLYSLCSQLCYQHGIMPDKIIRHKDVSPTACPGLYMDIDSIKRVVGRTYLYTLPQIERS